MHLLGSTLVILAFMVALDSVNGQFYVDIEHSLPRIGKRGEEANQVSSANTLKELLGNRKLQFKQESRDENEDYEKELMYSAARTIQLLKLLNKNYETQK